ncbi:MAG TPA: hypothetical protein VFA90_17275 [Terriglobales bacterium]|nr:hypothetical protein [Terriglobales bacterium]
MIGRDPFNGRRWPRKLKRHIANLVRFWGLCAIAQLLVEGGHQFGFWDHYALSECCLLTIYCSVSAWFIWRGYTGMVRDLDFYDDDYDF